MLVLTTVALDEYVYEALRVGASRFLLKDTPPRPLLEAIAAAVDGDVLISPAMTRRFVAEFVRRPIIRPDELSPSMSSASGSVKCSPRSHETRPTPRAVSSLHMSPLTAKTHVSRILGKLNARDRAQLVIIG